MERPKLNRVWASGSESETKDPGNEKYQEGWIAEIPTYQVLNYLQNKIDTTLLSLGERGIFEWGSDISYKLHALVWNEVDGQIYISITDNPDMSLSPDKNPDQWEASSIQITRTEFDNLNSTITTHINSLSGTNPHKLEPHDVDTYSRDEIDNMVGKDSDDNAAHIADMDNPHQTTAEKAGAVSIEGGEYTGPVTMGSGVTNLNSDGSAKIDSTGDVLGIVINNSGLGVDSSGKAGVINSGTFTPFGTAATLDATTSTTDNTIGHVLKVGDRGLGMTVINSIGIDFNTYYFSAGETLFLKMADCTNIPDGIDKDYVIYAYVNVIGVRNLDNNVGILIGDDGGAKYYWAVRSTDSSGVTSWKVRILPQSAADVSAIPSYIVGTIADGGSMADANITGWWEISVNDTSTVAGFPTYANGSYLYGYGFMYVDIISGDPWFQHYYSHHGVNAKRQNWSAGPDTTTDWIVDYNEANPPPATDLSAYMTSSTANGKFVTGTRFGANMSTHWGSDGGTAPAGCALTGGDFGDGDSYPYYAYMQYCVSGTWINASGGVGAEKLVSANHYQAVPDGTISLLTNLKPYLRESNHLPGLVGVQHYIDDNGYDWFEAAPKLAGAVFIAVALDSGVIVQIADSSLPDTDAFSLYPDGVTVAGLDSLPAGCTIDGTWKFDGTTVYQDEGIVAARVLAENTSLRTQYAATAALNIATLQAGIAINSSVEGDSDALTAWQGYLCDLRDMTSDDLQQSPAVFPDAPASIL